ncbi:hypothetical protein [Agromyces sp. Leaf222]|uniref:hypothetical protein n=1 Tax=Agromyces sp. Leaf222 TaxID=1735688 RepID=UPI0006F5D003|nr:hypothetical protein [Agromyces sp. Leaf222]KQM81406.1 hypothetical protein ASE68_16700 [Agromyces sp. Leaf222]
MTTTQNLDLTSVAPASAAPTATEQGAAVAVAPTATPTTPPSIHVRALLTWIAIFPLVTIGLTLIAPVAEAWPPVLRALVLTVVVVPTAVYLVMPQLLKGHGRLARRRAARRG